MQRLRYYILSLIAVIMLCACADDADIIEQNIQFCVYCEWSNGRADETRALSATNILADGGGDISIATEDYPATISVSCSDDRSFTLAKATSSCGSHAGFYVYTTSEMLKESDIADNLTFTATATLADGDELTGEATKAANLVGNHLQLTLHHTKALLRFAFKVAKKYDQLRFVKITQIKLNNTICPLVEKVLNKGNATLIAYAYVDPAVVTISKSNTLACTYDIYDKDAIFDGSMNAEALKSHLTREGVVATNTFTLGSLKKGDESVTEIQSGYYYDLNITLNPDYLYVLSEHDNKHITIE